MIVGMTDSSLIDKALLMIFMSELISEMGRYLEQSVDFLFGFKISVIRAVFIR